MRTKTTIALITILATLSGCDPDTPPLTPDGGMPPGDPVYYYEDVRPILAEHCSMCHAPGGIAPFDLVTYEHATEVGERMAQVTRDRIMPPFVVDASGDCNEYSNARRLDQEEIDTIGAWVAGGMLEGDPTTAEPPRTELPALETVSATIDIGIDYAPDDSVNDDYRCFVVDPTWDGVQYLTGADVRPGNPEVVHHLIVYAPTSAGEAANARAMDGADGRPGYQCYGDAVVLALPVILWAPGAGAQEYPEGTGIAVNGDLPLIVQMHYNLLANNGEPDRTQVDVTLADSVRDEASMGLLADFGIEIPPRMPEVTTSYDGTMIFAPSGALRVWGTFPHMHTMGRRLRVDTVASSPTCMVDVPR
ncbi:MAG: hypothetical protein KC619_17925, partial [Myxococcales bacterium]|nr:hypothetical protein [Myxococcales bacterium]